MWSRLGSWVIAVAHKPIASMARTKQQVQPTAACGRCVRIDSSIFTRTSKKPTSLPLLGFTGFVGLIARVQVLSPQKVLTWHFRSGAPCTWGAGHAVNLHPCVRTCIHLLCLAVALFLSLCRSRSVLACPTKSLKLIDPSTPPRPATHRVQAKGKDPSKTPNL